MDIEKRLSNLENLVDYLSKQIERMRFYTDADTAGTRQSVSDITPYTDVKTAYIGDTEVVFENVPTGNLSIFIEPNCGFTFERNLDTVNIYFVDPLDEVTNVTISIQ